MLSQIVKTVSVILSQVLVASVAVAQAVPPAPGTPNQQAPGWMQFVPIAVIMFVFYFFLIRPQAKKQKEQMNFLSTLKVGDQVVTQSGIFGRVAGINEPILNLEVANNVQIKILKTQILALQTPAAANK